MRNFLNKTIKLFAVLASLLFALGSYGIYQEEGVKSALSSLGVSLVFIYLTYFVLRFFININIDETKKKFTPKKIERVKDLSSFKKVIKFCLIHTPIALALYFGSRFLMHNASQPLAIYAQMFNFFVAPFYLIIIAAKFMVGLFNYMIGTNVENLESIQSSEQDIYNKTNDEYENNTQNKITKDRGLYERILKIYGLGSIIVAVTGSFLVVSQTLLMQILAWASGSVSFETTLATFNTYGFVFFSSVSAIILGLGFMKMKKWILPVFVFIILRSAVNTTIVLFKGVEIIHVSIYIFILIDLVILSLIIFKKDRLQGKYFGGTPQILFFVFEFLAILSNINF